jgi:hypothetical protein
MVNTAVSLVELATFLLAVFGVSVTVSTLDGPFGLCSMLRQWLQAKFRGTKHNWIAKGIACPICVSFWVSPIVAVLTLSGFEIVGFVLSGVGVTAVVVWLSPPADDNDDHAPPGLPGNALGTPLPGGVLRSESY